METILVAFVLIVLLILIVFLLKGAEKELDREKNKKILYIKQKEEELKDKKYIIDKIVIDEDNRYVFFINKIHEKIVFCDSVAEMMHVFKFSEIVDFEIIEDKNIIFKSSAGGMIAGGLLYGGVGALAGANLKKQLVERCYLLKIKIYFNNIDCPEINMNFLEQEVKRSSKIYIKARENMEKFASILKVIIKNKETRK